jgi:hypothetical protein
MKRIAIVLFVILLSGCMASSDNPVSAPSMKEADARLVGTWKLLELDKKTGKQRGVAWLHIGWQKNNRPFMDAVMVVFEKGEVDIARYHLFVSKLGDKTYMNIKEEKSGKISPAFMIMKYTIDSKKGLTMYLMNNIAAKDLVRASKLKGTVKGTFSGVRITDTSANIAKILQADDSKLFNSPMRPFSKVR